MQTQKEISVENLRPISIKRMNQLEKEVRRTVNNVDDHKAQIQNLESIVSTKTLTVVVPEEKSPSKKKGVSGEHEEKPQPQVIHLTTAQVRGFRLELVQKKLALRTAKTEMKKAGAEFSKACIHNGKCVSQQSKRFTARLEKESKAKREKDDRKTKITKTLSRLMTKKDNRVLSLTEAVTDGRKFRAAMDDLLKEVDQDTYATISGLSSVKSEIYSDIRNALKGDSEDTSNDGTLSGALGVSKDAKKAPEKRSKRRVRTNRKQKQKN